MLRAVTPSMSVLVLCCAAAAAQSAPAGAGDCTYTVGGVEVRRWQEAGAVRASWQRNGVVLPLRAPDDRLHFVLQAFDPLAGVPQFPGPLGVPVGTRLRLVQFHTQVLEPYRAEVEAVGAEILHYMPANALFVRCDAPVVDVLRALPCVRSVVDLANAFKLDAALRAFLAGTSTAAIDCNVVLASKDDRAAVLARTVAIGGVVLEPCEGSVMVQLRLDRAQLEALLATDLVTWADVLQPDGVDMDNARIQGGANVVEAVGGHRGYGVRAEITESFDETHADLVGRVSVRGINLVDPHGHCTAGILGGNGASDFASRGMLPECSLVEGAYSSSNHFAQILGSVDPVLPWRTMVATASWGAGVTTAYNSISQAIDDALFVSDLTRLNSQSNTGNQSSRPEAWAKNIISVGGLKHLDDAVAGNDRWNDPSDTWAASIGPAADGRLKPDISAYFDAVRTTDLPGAAGYVPGDHVLGFSGTSAATPIVAGYVGLIHEMFTDGLFGNRLPMPAIPAERFANKPHMTTSKALLCNTAMQYPFAGTGHDLTRTHQGWGFPSVERLHHYRDRIVVLDEYDTLTMGGVREYWVQIDPGTPEFRATLVWADPAAQPNASIHLVNDLHLKVTRHSDGVFWWGNQGLDVGTESTTGGAPNDRDTIECVYLPNPVPGTYRVRVEAAAIVQDGKLETPALDVDFSLVFHPVGAGYRAPAGPKFDLVSEVPGEFVLRCGSLPMTGWTEGFTALSLTTDRERGFGRFFGLEDDGITGGLWSWPMFANNPFHFPNVPGTYPFVDYTLPPAIALTLSGWQIDAMLVLFDGAEIATVSNVARTTIQ